MHGVLDAVAAEHRAIAPIHFAARDLTLGEKAAAGDAAQPFRDNRPRDLDVQSFPRLRSQAHATRAEAIPRHFVTVSDHIEPRLAAHQLGQVESDHARVVGDESHLMRRAQFDERHGPAAALFNDLNSARRGHRDRREAQGDEQPRHDATARPLSLPARDGSCYESPDPRASRRRI